jgi:hypothetical protein
VLSDYKVESSRKIRELEGELAISKSAEVDARKQVSMAKVLSFFLPYIYTYTYTHSNYIFELYVCMYVCMHMIGPNKDSEREGRHPNAAYQRFGGIGDISKRQPQQRNRELAKIG